MSKRVGWMLFVALLLFGLVGTLSWQLVQQSKPLAVWELADGQVVKVYGPFYGTQHIDPFTSPWIRLASKFPEPLRKRFKIPAPPKLNNPGNTNFVSFWFLREGIPTKPLNPWNQEFKVLIGDGSSYAGSHNQSLRNTNRFGWMYEGHAMDLWPRHIDTWDLRVYEGDHPYKPIGSVQVNNRWKDQVTQPWKGQPLPARVVQDDIEFILTGLWVGKPPEWSPDDQDPNEPIHSRTRLTFDIQENGQRTTNWVAYHVQEMKDAYGHQSDGNSWSHGWINETECYIEFAEWPLPTIGAWTVNVEFMRQGDFTESAFWDFSNIPIQATMDPPQILERDGRSLTVKGIKREGFSSSYIRLNMEVTIDPPLQSGERLRMFEANNQNGDVLESGGWGGGSDRWNFYLRIKDTEVDLDTLRLDLRLTLYPSRFAEFLVEPKKWPGDSDKAD